MNDIEKIYKEFGEGMCLWPFIGAFYSCVDSVDGDVKEMSNFIRPCSLVRWEGEDNPWYIQPGVSLKDSRNTDRWLYMREQFLAGKWRDLPDCKTCQYTEDFGNMSPRLNNNQFLADEIQDDIIELVKEIQQNDLQSQTLKMLEYYPSNYCNLECTMCGGGASTARHVFEVKHLGYNSRIIVNPADPDFFDTLGDLEILGFTGGETTMQPEVHLLLNKLIETGTAANVIITLLTNASAYPIALVEKFKQFKKVMYTVSIDGIGDVIEYQRRGCKWENVEDTALKIHNNPDIHEVINIVVTSMNILNMMDLIDWCYEYKINMLIVSPVVRVEYLGPSCMPEEIRNVAMARLQAGRDRYNTLPEPWRSDYVKVIDQLIGNIVHNPFKQEDLDKFITHIEKENIVSKKPLHEIVPEWAPYF